MGSLSCFKTFDDICEPSALTADDFLDGLDLLLEMATLVFAAVLGDSGDFGSGEFSLYLVLVLCAEYVRISKNLS